MTTDPAVLSPEDVEPAKPASAGELTAIRDLAAKLYTAKRKIVAFEEAIEKEKFAVKMLEERDLPTAMSAVGMKKFSLDGGFEVSIEDVVAGSLTKERTAEGHAWLEKNGHGSIVKHTITVFFGKDEDAWAKKFLADLAKRKKPLRFERKDAVAPQTLGKFVREMVELEKAGELPPTKKIPRDLFGVFEMTRARMIDPVEEAQKAAEAKKRGAKKRGVEGDDS